MATYRNKFRISHVLLKIKNRIATWSKGDVPTYIVTDIMNRLNKGEQEIVLPMCSDIRYISIVDYLNEYHKYRKKAWKLDFLNHAFEFTSERIKQKLDRFKDIEVEILDISDTDKRVVIIIKEKGE